MKEHLKTSYDDVPYESNPFPQTHPEHLATLAALFGMTPPEVRVARVLELGCASGGNLIPHAVCYPEAQFLGIDLSARQIVEGQTEVSALNLSNIELRHASITDVGREDGQFDYIICHGVYSWVPDEVQQKILQICNANLSPQGVAYVSYNTYPGWHMRGMVRDMMRYHTAQLTEPATQVSQARALLDFLSSNAPRAEHSPYGVLLKSELDLLSKQKNSYLFHEHLEAVNDPIYFHEFASRAAQAGLQYLAESDFSAMLASNFPTEVAETLRKVAPDIIRMEQYMDFLRNRQFRQTLLVHKSAVLRRNLGPDSVREFHVASAASRADAGNESSPGGAAYQTSGGARLVTGKPLVKAAMDKLIDIWPESIHFSELLRNALADLPQAQAHDESIGRQATAALGQDLLHAYSAKVVEFSRSPLGLVGRAGSRPKTTSLARRQAERRRGITTLRHHNVSIDDFGRHVLLLLDGSRSVEQLVDALTIRALTGVLNVSKDGKLLTDQPTIRDTVEKAVDDLLGRLGKLGLLVA